MQHLVPILQSGFFQDENLHVLRELISSHAGKGLEFLQLARQLYTSRFCMPLISFCTVYLGDAMFVASPRLHPGLPERGPSQVFRLCLELLQQTRAGFAVCGPIQKGFYNRAMEHGIIIPDDMGEVLGSFAHYDMDSVLAAFTRLSYAHPLKRLLPMIHPGIAEEWPAARRKSRTDRTVRIASLLNSE